MTNQDREYLDAKFTGVRAEFKACTDLLSYKMDDVITHQKAANGHVKYLDKKTRFAQWVQGHPKISVIFFVLSIAVIVFVVDVFGFKTLVQAIIR